MLTPRIHAVLPLLVVLAVAAPTAADDGASEPANQIVVFGGVSLLDAARESSYSWEPDFPGFPGRPGFPGFPGGRFPAIDVRAATTLGNSALLGVRYSRYIKDRLAVEADLQVAPGHDLEAKSEICAADRCFGGGELGRFGLRPPDGGYPVRNDRRVTAWQYGAGLAYDITGGDVRPVVIVGAGGATWSGSGQTSTDFELRFGGGLKILFGNLGARVDVVDHLVLDHFLSGKSEHNVQVTAGFLVGF